MVDAVMLERFIHLIEPFNNIVISSHVNPDGDAVGSCLSLALCMKKMLKNAVVVLEEYNDKFNIIPGKELIYKGDLSEITADVFIALDCADEKRLGRAYELFKRTPVTVNIDHHISNVGYADFNFVFGDLSSTSEILFDMINMLVAIDNDIASAIFAGIVYDTGGFRHPSTGTNTHIVASRLMELGIPFSDIYNQLLFSRSITEAKIMEKALNQIVWEEGSPVTYSYLTIEQINEIGAKDGDFSGIADYLLNIQGTQVSFFARERAPGEIKISFRSKGLDVSEIAKNFGGGGHKLAAGCTINDSMDKAISFLLAAISDGLVGA